MLSECPGGTNQIGECILINIGHMIVLIQTRTRMDLQATGQHILSMRSLTITKNHGNQNNCLVLSPARFSDGKESLVKLPYGFQVSWHHTC